MADVARVIRLIGAGFRTQISELEFVVAHACFSSSISKPPLQGVERQSQTLLVDDRRGADELVSGLAGKVVERAAETDRFNRSKLSSAMVVGATSR
ncbi:hypothetical protein [Burkholderia oklahomensis]|uniref:hypothetical protein n=1 Tax=Burkholderia oklahomensis TaxID=342113 RepID=UPI00130E8AE0|nr:hypothetical protein [Burkholderia oklahomensis]QPS40861.1 hypothetical protein I6G57_21525 [Burkholderia oklahomensis]